ncbi:prenyltransferase/squalene oxidase repeat-containing protein [Thalassoglobus sp. JC818]|uniref:prenyltransferase/squalene oxidase repeat-containing protein n=1 Tax=Thalassoglobus sp. JC818 TaxID=3232136 RepID=UPI0034582196
MLNVDRDRLERAEQTVRDQLLSRRNASGCWAGRLSASPLSTATAVMALHQVQLARGVQEGEFTPLIVAGLQWLSQCQNEDGGWGDTLKSHSNISTSMLVFGSFRAVGLTEEYSELLQRADDYIQRCGGSKAVVERYGRDKTFSVPILTHLALAGLVDWKDVSALPFELACLPHQFYATIRLPVVSYALPALIAIGQVRHHFRKPWNPLLGWLRDSLIPKSLRILKRIQPESGGFLEATPLTSFVVMSLAAKGNVEHPVVESGVKFLVDSVLDDGSWPIDTNLATWVTTLSSNAISSTLTEEERSAITEWLLGQQYRKEHPYTHAAPGGWAWTDLSGGVPDADDTPGAILALLNLNPKPRDERIAEACKLATQWLVDLQNRDGGWPTFCRGWGTLPFDRSSTDITAHCLRALHRVSEEYGDLPGIESAIRDGFDFLNRSQNADGSWHPLWFGNQFAPSDINPVYGTSKVIRAYQETERTEALPLQDGVRWLRSAQNSDGGWGGVQGAPSSVEETALAVDALIDDRDSASAIESGINWLIDRVESNTVDEAAPIGFYFAKLWYFEELYPVIFASGALRRAVEDCQPP